MFGKFLITKDNFMKKFGFIFSKYFYQQKDHNISVGFWALILSTINNHDNVTELLNYTPKSSVFGPLGLKLVNFPPSLLSFEDNSLKPS